MTSPILFWATITFIFLSLLSFPSNLNATSRPTKIRQEVTVARHGAVATDDGRCSRVGMHVIRDGGHAIDAAVAAALCLGVVNPASSGIGGGAFMLVRLANGLAQAFDMRETAPLQASKDMYAGNFSLKAEGPLSIAVPGELAGLHKAWKQHGKLPWERLVKPAERLARLGFKISPYLHMQMTKTESGIFADKGLREMFTSNGSLLQIGDICHNKKLAQTLGRISDSGIEAFYNGSIGFNLVRDLQKVGGILTMKDLQEYQVKLKTPINARIGDLELFIMPPPSGGPPMILMLNILAQYGFPSGLSGSLGIHRTIEALKHALSVRMNLGDPDFVNISKVLVDMLSPRFAKELKKTIYDNMTFGPNHYGDKWNPIHDHGTSHLSVIDSERNSVSLTTTVNAYFGSLIQSPSTGIVLNNEMDDFSIPGNYSAGVRPPAPANFVSPGKRPLSSMSPTIVVRNGRLIAVLGTSGGAMIFPATAQIFLNHFVRGMNPLSSVLTPRVYHQLIPNVVKYENWTTITGDHFEVPAHIREVLKKKGHVLEGLAGGTICQLVVQAAVTSKNNRDPGLLVAVSDPRKGGFPAGF